MEDEVVDRVCSGESVGTYFHARPKKASARRLWIAFGQPPKGTVVVDAGARKALVDGHRSLLPVGVRSVAGRFEAGDAVDVADEDQKVFARGLVRYASSELEGARGRSTLDLDGGEVIHRDQLVVLEGS
jgi:glutamate 5-kinase